MKNLGLFGGEIGWMENFGEKMGMKTILECDWLDKDWGVRKINCGV